MNNQQYTAVVAQNKSLQGELAVYKRMVDKLIRELAVEQLTNIVLDLRNLEDLKYLQYRLQELEAENE